MPFPLPEHWSFVGVVFPRTPNDEPRRERRPHDSATCRCPGCLAHDDFHAARLIIVEVDVEGANPVGGFNFQYPETD